MQARSPKNGCGPRWINCIIPGVLRSEIFQRTLQFDVWSLAEMRSNSWYTRADIIFSSLQNFVAIRLTFKISSTTTLILGFVLQTFVVGVTLAIIPIPWNVPFPCNVLIFWSALSAMYWMKSVDDNPSISLPWHFFQHFFQILVLLDRNNKIRVHSMNWLKISTQNGDKAGCRVLTAEAIVKLEVKQLAWSLGQLM